MPYNNDDFKVVLGYFKDGKFVEVPLENAEFVEDAFEEDEKDANPYTPLAEQYYLIYSAFINAGFKKNHAFSFTRDVLREIKEITNAEKN